MNSQTVIRDPTAPKSKTQWRKLGRGIKEGEAPTKIVKIHGKPVGLFGAGQTTKHTPYVVARNYLVDLFVGYPVRFGYTAKGTNDVFSADAEGLVGSVKSVVERGFNYQSCKKGIRFGRRSAESFHVTSPEQTNWFVIDLDNHDPSLQTTQAHLDLVGSLQNNLPSLLSAVGAKTSFFQYRSIEPTGIQLWVVTHRQWDRATLHKVVRKFLISLGPPLDTQLKNVRLAGLADIEIKPTSSFISMIGCYGKEVFTTDRLKIVDKRFDCIGLYDHIRNGIQSGDVLKRYSPLVLVRDLESRPPSKTVGGSGPQQLSAINLNQSGKLIWADLKLIALNGVQVPDHLHDFYLEPLAQALLLREFYNCPDREKSTFLALRDWVLLKHNGFVSRLESANVAIVENQIRSTIKGVLKKTPAGILSHYEKMRSKDKQYPARIEHLVPLMKAQPNTGPLLLIDCKAGVSVQKKVKKTSQSKTLPTLLKIPKTISSELSLYLKACVRQGKMAERVFKFAHLLISEIGEAGSKEINESRLHQLARKKPGSDPTYLRSWKNHLVKAGILKKGWQNNIVRGVRSSKYQLTDRVMSQLRRDLAGLE